MRIVGHSHTVGKSAIRSRASDTAGKKLDFGRAAKSESFTDADGNVAYRVILEAGLNEIQHDALAEVSTASDKSEQFGNAPSVATLEPAFLRYLLPSRYCDSDKLFAFAREKFGHICDAGAQVQAISDWVHNNIEYRFASGRSDISAAQIIERGYGVCRDFAHCTIALCTYRRATSPVICPI